MTGFCLFLIVWGIAGTFASYKIGVWTTEKEIWYIKKGEFEKARNQLKLTRITMTIACVSILSIFSALITLPFIINGSEEKTENPLVTTIDKLIAGKEVPVQEMRQLLAITVYPSVEFWADEKNIPKEEKGVVISTVSEAISKATVKIELPADFLSEITGDQREKEK